MRRQGVKFRGKRKNWSIFFNSLYFNNDHIYKKVPHIKVVSFQNIYNFVTRIFTYKCRFKNQYIVKRNFGGWCQDFYAHSAGAWDTHFLQLATSIIIDLRLDCPPQA